MQRYVGVDLGIATPHKAKVFDAMEPRGPLFEFDLSPEGLERLLAQATEERDGPVCFVMEPTGMIWKPLSAWLMEAGHCVIIPKAQKVSDLRKFYKKHTKSDAIDAATLARLPQVDPDGVHPARPTPASETSLRRLIQRHDRLEKGLTANKQRLDALMQALIPTLIKALGSSKWTAAALAFYRRYADPAKVVKLGPTRLSRSWARHSRGKGDTAVARRVYQACRSAVDLYRGLRQSGRLPFEYEAMQEEAAALVEEIEQCKRDKDQLERRIFARYVAQDPDATLRQLKGFGKFIAPAIDALVGDIARFKNAKAFVSFNGVCPRKKKSGKSDKASLAITKAGNPLLRKYLYLAVKTARHWDPEFAAYYARRYAQGAHHNQIMVALMRKMATRVYHLLKRRQQARQDAPQGHKPAKVVYELRDAEGNRIDPKAARRLIQERYARDKVAPQRAARERAMKKTGDAEAVDRWPPKDATNGSSTLPSSSRLPERARRSKRAKRPNPGIVSIAEPLQEATGELLKGRNQRARNRDKKPAPEPEKPLAPT